MSTELINRHREGYQLTGFYGGDTRGYCLQITGDHGYVQLTREAAACLAADIFRYFLKTPEPSENAEYPQAAEVCAELYQVIGSLASDLGVFDHPKVVKALDNASQHAMVHDDVLPFPSFEWQPAGMLGVGDDARDVERYRLIRDLGASFRDYEDREYSVCEGAMDSVLDSIRAAL